MKEKVGKADKSVDVGFKQEVEKFEANYKIMKKLSKDLSQFSKQMTGTIFLFQYKPITKESVVVALLLNQSDN